MIDRVIAAVVLGPHITAAITTLPWGGWLIALDEKLVGGSPERTNAVCACTKMIDRIEAGDDTPIEGTVIVRDMMIYT